MHLKQVSVIALIPLSEMSAGSRCFHMDKDRFNFAEANERFKMKEPDCLC